MSFAKKVWAPAMLGFCWLSGCAVSQPDFASLWPGRAPVDPVANASEQPQTDVDTPPQGSRPVAQQTQFAQQPQQPYAAQNAYYSPRTADSPNFARTRSRRANCFT